MIPSNTFCSATSPIGPVPAYSPAYHPREGPVAAAGYPTSRYQTSGPGTAGSPTAAYPGPGTAGSPTAAYPGSGTAATSAYPGNRNSPKVRESTYLKQ